MAGSYFDHSCDPNAEAVFDGRILTIKATKHFKTDDKLSNVTKLLSSKTLMLLARKLHVT